MPVSTTAERPYRKGLGIAESKDIMSDTDYRTRLIDAIMDRSLAIFGATVSSI
jgi:hypothetical protein